MKYNSTETVNGVASDGPPENVAKWKGAIRYLEEFLGRALQWQICALHLNELCWKHLFIEIGN